MGVKGFVEGGIASIVAGCSTHPLDLIKVRMQLQGEPAAAASATAVRPALAFNATGAAFPQQHLHQVTPPARLGPLGVGMQILRSEGPAALFAGVSATMLRQTLYSTTRMARSEGVGSLWRGSSMTVNRAMIVTASQLATYDQAKESILESGAMADGLGTHVVASFAAGIVAALASNPVDVIKTRVMNMKVEPGGAAAPYKGALDCALKTVRAEGPMALYKGFVPTVCRQGPFTVVLFVTLEQVRKILPKDF